MLVFTHQQIKRGLVALLYPLYQLLVGGGFTHSAHPANGNGLSQSVSETVRGM